MDETTQQNAALVEEATAAARSLEEQAVQLTEAVAVFKTDAGYVAAPLPHASRPAVTQAIKAKVVAAGRTAASKPRAVVTTASNEASWQEF